MVAAILNRIVELAVTLLVTSLVIFASLYLVPGSPVSYLARGRDTDAGTIARITAEYHLNDPFPLRYWEWLSGLFHGDFGHSLAVNAPAWTVLEPRIAPTLLLVALAAIETIVIGGVLGIVASMRRGVVDGLITVVSTTGVAIPSFAAAAVLLAVFSVGLGWFPVYGSGAGFADMIHHLTLPSIALAVSSLAYMTRLTRATVRDELTREYVETGRARGLTSGTILRRHVLRNATPSMLTAAGVTIVGLMASEVVVESAFGLNGLGSLLVTSIGAKDFAVVQAILLIYVAVFMVVNTIADVLAMASDPRLQRRARIA